MRMVRLVYASRFASGVGPNHVERILEQSRAQNPGKGITGVLCYDPRFFLQCLEGPRKAVNALYVTIAQDERHQDVTLLEYSEVHERAFERWSMAYVKADAETELLLRKYSTGDKFDPYEISGKQALGLILELSEARESYLEAMAQPAGAEGS